MNKELGKIEVRDKKKWEIRLDKLKHTIEKHMNKVPDKSMTIEYLFYDKV